MRTTTNTRSELLEIECAWCADGRYRDGLCTACGSPETVQEFVRSCGTHLFVRASGDALVICHGCRRKTRRSEDRCMHCHQPRMGPKKRFRKQRLKMHFRRYKLRWLLILSIVLHLTILHFTVGTAAFPWGELAITSVFSSVALSFFYVFVQRAQLGEVLFGAPPLVNLRRSVDLLSLSLLAQHGVHLWWPEASLLAAHLLVIWGGGFTFYFVIQPMLLALYKEFFQKGDALLNPTDPQGGQASYDID
jgi:hypothetical protein